jgi:hypothetical protein
LGSFGKRLIDAAAWKPQMAIEVLLSVQEVL